MRQPSILSLLALGVASASAWQQLVPNAGSMPVAGPDGLIARQVGECNSCAECFGDGYVVCDNIGCFNPAKYQQCCSNANLCVAKTNNCCSDLGGPGVTGTSGYPTGTPTTAPTATQSLVEYTCHASDTGEQCCQRAPMPLHWCSGEFPSFSCYNEKNQWCCTDGTVCDEENCCELFSASTTHPWAATATSTPTGSKTAASSGSATGSITQAPASGSTGASTGTPSSTSKPNSAASLSLKAEMLVLGVAALGLCLL